MSDETVDGFGPTTRSQIARALDARRVSLDLTLERVAVLMDMSPSSVANLMSGNHTYPIQVLERVLRALNMSLVEFAFELAQPKVKDTPIMREVGELLRKLSDPETVQRRQAESRRRNNTPRAPS